MGFILKLYFELMSIKLNQYNSQKQRIKLIFTFKVVILRNKHDYYAMNRIANIGDAFMHIRITVVYCSKFTLSLIHI